MSNSSPWARVDDRLRNRVLAKNAELPRFATVTGFARIMATVLIGAGLLAVLCPAAPMTVSVQGFQLGELDVTNYTNTSNLGAAGLTIDADFTTMNQGPGGQTVLNQLAPLGLTYMQTALFNTDLQQQMFLDANGNNLVGTFPDAPYRGYTLPSFARPFSTKNRPWYGSIQPDGTPGALPPNFFAAHQYEDTPSITFGDQGSGESGSILGLANVLNGKGGSISFETALVGVSRQPPANPQANPDPAFSDPYDVFVLQDFTFGFTFGYIGPLGGRQPGQYVARDYSVQLQALTFHNDVTGAFRGAFDKAGPNADVEWRVRLIQADATAVPEPGTWVTVLAGTAILVFRRRALIVLAAAVVFTPSLQLNLEAQTPVTLSPVASPTAGQSGVTPMNVTISGFPDGTIQASDVTIVLEPVTVGPPGTTTATVLTTVDTNASRVTFTIPPTITVTAPTAYSLSVAGMTTAGASFASSNKASLTVSPEPRISSVTPPAGQAGQNLPVSITGEFTTFVQGSTQANFGAGISVGGAPEGTFGPVMVTSSTSATAPLNINSGVALGTRDVTVRTDVQQATLPAAFKVAKSSPSPVISEFYPTYGRAGTLVKVSGTNFGSDVQVTLCKQGGGTIAVPIAASSDTAIVISIPAEAATGAITVNVNGKTASSRAPLTISPKE